MIVALVFYITIVNYLNRIALSYAILPVEGDLQLTDAQFGFIASGFTIGYFLTTLPSGVLVDKFGSIRIWTLAAAVWSLIVISISFVTHAYLLFALLLLLGIAEGSHFPALLKTIGDWLEPRWRSRSLALSLLGVPMASVIGGPFLTSLIATFGWRAMFVVLGILSLVWVIVWHLSFRGKHNPHLSSADTPFDPKEKIHWRPLFSSSPFRLSCLIYFTFGYLLFFGLVWVPGYLQKMHGVSLKETGYLVIFPWILSGISLLAGGWISDYLYKKTHSLRISRAYPMIGGLLGASLCFYCLTLTTSLVPALLFLSLALASAFFFNAPIYALNVDLFPKNAATAQGIITCFSSIGGTISSALTGRLVESSGDFQSAMLLASGLSLITALVALFAPKPKY